MPTENRSSNTEQHDHIEGIIDMVSVPREPTREMLNGVCMHPDLARSLWGALLKNAPQPAPQPHPEPIAWMVGTAFWWTKEKAERDAVAMGLPVVGLGPMTGIAPAEQHQVEPVAYQIRSKTDRPDSQWTPWRECCETTRAMHSHEVGRFNQYGIMREIRPVFTHSDSGEVERLRADLTEMTTFRDNAANHMKRIRAEATAFEKERDALRAKLAERDSRLRELLADDIPLRVAAKIEAALSASAEQEVKS